MDIMELGAIGELVGGAAVIVTLFYLAIQVRQNTRSNRLVATQGLVAGQASANLLAAVHGDLAAIMNTGVFSEDDLTPKERHRFNCYLIAFYVQVDFAYQQFLAGQLDESVWNRMESEFVFFHLPGITQWWAQDKQRFSPEFVDTVDRYLAAGPAPVTMPTMVYESDKEDR